MAPIQNIDRLSFNQITYDPWNLKEAIDACVRAEIPWISIWRNKIAEAGLADAKKWVQDAGIGVSSICRGGMFPAATALERKERIEENKRAIVEAAELGAEVLVLVCGPGAGKDLQEARKMVADGIAEIVPFAESHGVKLGIEPLHPMYAAERSVVVSLAQANEMAEIYKPHQVGVVIDVFHVWWDPDLYAQIKRAEGRILGFHVNDWIVPTPDMLKGRGMMGDGVIEIRRIREAVDQAGYTGPIEVEIFNQSIWDQKGDDVIALMKDRFVQHV